MEFETAFVPILLYGAVQICTCCTVQPTWPATLCLAAALKLGRSFRSSGNMALQRSVSSTKVHIRLASCSITMQSVHMRHRWKDIRALLYNVFLHAQHALAGASYVLHPPHIPESLGISCKVGQWKVICNPKSEGGVSTLT